MHRQIIYGTNCKFLSGSKQESAYLIYISLMKSDIRSNLKIEEIPCFEINNDASGPPVADMVPYFQKVQSAGRSLLIRGAFTPDELQLLMDSLEARGLFLNIMVKSMAEIETLRPLVGM